MDLHRRYGLTTIVNAAGSFTPLGVSRSSPGVAAAAAAALSQFFLIEELQDRASAALARATGAEAGAVVHCAAAGITLAVAAAIAGTSAEAAAALPDTRGRAAEIVIAAGHVVDYGHSILQDIRLAGATPVIAGSDDVCSIAEIEGALAGPGVAGLLLVSSRLTRGAPVDFAGAVAAARRRGVLAIIDGAAQDLRVRALVETGADLVVLSGQKYLAAPTAGLIAGRAVAVAALRAQEKGIGRAMKASKEAILGALAALDEREALDLAGWSQAQHEKVARFVARAARLPGLHAEAAPDPTGLPFPRAETKVDAVAAGTDAAALAAALCDGTPSIRVMTHGLARGRLVFELVPLSEAEIETILARLEALLDAARRGRR
jgi:L-seryl-tRNA(Ser) seleniumtransferase